jgi:hypothetical protein
VETRRRFLCSLAAVLPVWGAAAAGEQEDTAADVFASAAGGVVAVGVLAGGTGGAPASFTVLSSGLVWDSQGHIVTPYSLINPALRQSGPQASPPLPAGGATVCLQWQPPADRHSIPLARPLQSQLCVMLLRPGGASATLPATLVSREPSLELVVLALPPDAVPGLGLRPPVLARSSLLQVGQDAYLVGSTPAGARTLSAGVVSATARAVPAPNGQAIRGVVQTDAEVSTLGLGGALLDSRGHVIGMPTVSYAKPGAGRSAGVNFALGSDALLEAVPNMVAYGAASGRR